jgi:hypothetical protein
MTVIENIMAGMHLRLRGNLLLGLWFRGPPGWKESFEGGKRRFSISWVSGSLEITRLSASLGKQKLLELGRASP